MIKNAVEIARKAAGDKYVALDIGPLGQLMEPYGTMSFEDAYIAFKEQIVIGSKAGADLVLIETMSDVYEAKAAILAAKENCNLSIICTMTFQEDGRTLTGTDPITMVNIIQSLGVDALGINCSLGPKEILPMIEEVSRYAKIPIAVQPNAGLPKVLEGRTIYDVTPEEFGEYASKMVEMGVSVLGGCCGTTPEHIKILKDKLKGIAPRKREVKAQTAASSAASTVIIGEGVKIIGERLNPTGKKRLKQALLSEDMDYILREALEQKEAKAHILDINVGLPEIDEKALMVKVIKEVQSMVNLPIQIDSVRPDVVEAAARICNGRPIINSVNGEEKIMESLFPIVKKYGCLVIALTLDEKGIPKTAEERLKVAEKIINKAGEYGIAKNDIIIDCLVLTASAQQEEVKETIKAVSLVKEKLGVRTTLGVSNISFGFPARGIINRTFLALALAAGLDAPIIDPKDEDMSNTINAFNVLWNYDKNARKYIEEFTGYRPLLDRKERKKHKDLKDTIIEGMKEEGAQLTRELLKDNSGLRIVDDYLIPALDLVGEKYEKGEIFLPQLIQSAETVKKAFEVIKDNMGGLGGEGSNIDKGKILIATVKGDIHDIGKNIVKVLLENYGFRVYDLGKDVEIEKIVTMVKEKGIPLVGLSALMTTTVKSMEDTIKALKEQCPSCNIMVGGAVLNEDYAKMIGADFYGKDAREAIKFAQKILLD